MYIKNAAVTCRAKNDILRGVIKKVQYKNYNREASPYTKLYGVKYRRFWSTLPLCSCWKIRYFDTECYSWMLKWRQLYGSLEIVG